ncbi:ABC transporter permease subunit [Epidermidibacterium keratini]|uniref:ABC transporter permease subunit n=1 Tax=Epidermidibacterium keratini TaxID=1891644 RepID=A0A7M3T522_9ACTN|nr:sugar ABC transporter permease [Epidermidibacterium keratini]QHB98879.1 ABC transporter permease subunit [Epidermidibacterium keratini]
MLVEVAPVHVTASAPPRRRRPPRLWPLACLLPAIALLIIWIYLPLAQAVELSTLRWNLLPTSQPQQVGLDNYARMLQSPATGAAALRTLGVVLGLCLFTVVLPVIACFALQHVGERAGRMLRAVFFLPYIMAPVAVAAIWQWLLDPRGPVNQLLGTGRNWVHEAGTALASLVLATGWHVLGFATVIVWAALTQISGSFQGAAAIDGATTSQARRWIIVPLLAPTLVFLALLTFLLGPQWIFPIIDTSTQGGPTQATTDLYYLLWQLGLTSFDAGASAAAGVLIFAGSAIVAALLTWIGNRMSAHAR